MPNECPQLFTVLEAAETLRCSRSRVFELLADGTLTRGRRFGRETVIIAESVFAALESDYHPTKPPAKRRRVPVSEFNQAIDAVVANARRRSA